jgi:hypothetical protein
MARFHHQTNEIAPISRLSAVETETNAFSEQVEHSIGLFAHRVWQDVDTGIRGIVRIGHINDAVAARQLIDFLNPASDALSGVGIFLTPTSIKLSQNPDDP